jgi:hypothetical protein
MEKYGAARQTIEDTIIGRRRDAICMPNNQDKNMYTLVIFINHCFSTATIVMSTRLIRYMYSADLYIIKIVGLVYL